MSSNQNVHRLLHQLILDSTFFVKHSLISTEETQSWFYSAMLATWHLREIRSIISKESLKSLLLMNTGPLSAVGNVSGYRCESDSKSRGHEFDPGPVLYFRGDWFLRSFSSVPLNHSRRVVVSYKRKYVHEVLVTRLFKLARKKSVVKWLDHPAMTLAVDFGRKATNNQSVFWWTVQ